MGHNGSTFLDLLLGSSKGVVSTSQLNDLLVNYDPFAEQKAVDVKWCKILGNLSHDIIDDLRHENKKVYFERNLLPFLISKRKRSSYLNPNEKLISAIFEDHSVSTIIDSSKNLTRALALSESSDFTLIFIHLVKDPRSFLCSFEEREQQRFGYLRGVKLLLIWHLKNFLAYLIFKGKREKYIRIRYEDFCKDPISILGKLEIVAGIDFSESKNIIRDNKNILPGDSLVFFGNRVLQKKEVCFSCREPKISKRIKSIFFLVGWPAKFFGYSR